MPAITGSTGVVSIKVSGNEVFFHANLWSLDWPLEAHDVTEFASTEGYQDTAMGLGQAAGSASGWYQDAGGSEVALNHTHLITDGAAFIMTASTGRTWTFTGNILTASLGSEKGVATPWSCTYEATTAPVPA